MSGSGGFPSALQVPARLIATLNDADLNELIRMLLRDQAYRCGCSDTSVNTDADAGQIIADHLGLAWSEVKYHVDRVHQYTGIAPRGGRYRYISPQLLGIYLASEAWETYHDELASLADALPSEAARTAYYAA